MEQEFLKVIDLKEILPVVLMSLYVSLSSTLIASTLGMFIGIPCALLEFKFKKIIIQINHTLMSVPPVLMGLLVYLLLSRKGPLGEFQLLFTPTAMIIAQTLLIFPIVFGLSISIIIKNGKDIRNTCMTLGANNTQTFFIIIKENKIQLLAVITAAFGRAISEVGAVMIVGGNIKGFTRVMTTYIALETGKGDFNEALVIGGILLAISFIINGILHFFQGSEDF
ncbi:ABC transporter permease [Clostridium oceanicum]|uniref:ABC transporter permease n=1 Tax=Clostridium oceanicum TaxID=1543 RepID=A0ABN1J8Z1_9CLOT